MVPQQQGDRDILAPIMPRALVVLRVPAGAAVLTAALDPALAGVEDRGQEWVDVAHPPHGEAANGMRFYLKDKGTIFLRR
jgi:hypothetical protein